MMTMRQLMADPIFRSYMKRTPPNTQPHNTTPAYRMWVKSETGSWLTKQGTYADLWPMFVRFLKAGNDVSLTNLRTFYAPPGEWRKVRVRLTTPRHNPATGALITHRIEERWSQTFEWPDMRHSWCGRCRRPVPFQPLFETHHALRRFPAISDEDNMRCPICGIRAVAQPALENMVRL